VEFVFSVLSVVYFHILTTMHGQNHIKFEAVGFSGLCLII